MTAICQALCQALCPALCHINSDGLTHRRTPKLAPYQKLLPRVCPITISKLKVFHWLLNQCLKDNGCESVDRFTHLGARVGQQRTAPLTKGYELLIMHLHGRAVDRFESPTESI